MKKLPHEMQIGDTVWHQSREEFCKIVEDTGDPTSVMVETDEGDWLEVTVALLEPSIFPADRRRSK